MIKRTTRCRTTHGGSYDIYVGPDLLRRVPELVLRSLESAESKRPHVAIFADAAVAEAAAMLDTALSAAGFPSAVSHVGLHRRPEQSEALKTLTGISPLYDFVVERGLDRSGILIALGGGALGDAVGFVAATYLRGVRWVVLPTTLLSQVDSAIGGKTALNHPRAKNLIGAFHSPSLVVCDTDVLKTLPSREWLSGLAEALKTGLATAPRLFRFLEQHGQAVLRGESWAVSQTVSACVRAKAALVQIDERDKNGRRAVLNLGHTLGHALEAATGYRFLRHGEAVLFGLRAALYLSLRTGRLDARSFRRIAAVVDGFLHEVPRLDPPRELCIESILSALRHDKKSANGKQQLILLEGIGRPVVVDAPEPALMEEAIRSLVAAVSEPASIASWS